MIQNCPAKWDFEADVVSVGSGIGGLSAAITAFDGGASAIILERADQVGGVTALSLGEVWVPGNHLAEKLGVNDSAESGYRYLKRLAMEYGEDSSMLNFVVHAREAVKYFEEHIGLAMRVIRSCPDYYYGLTNDAVAEGRLLEVLPFPAQSLGEWQSRTRVSPIAPYALSHVEMFEKGGGPANVANWDYNVMAERLMNDIRCLGAGLAAYFVKGAIDRGIPMHTDFNVEELIGDGERIIGVRGTQDGRDVFVKANRGVVVAVSSYEKNANFNKTLGTALDLQSMVFPSVDGANFRLTGPVGARIAKVPDISAVGFHVPGEESEDGRPVWRNALQPLGMPHNITVNRMGKRFGNEAFYRSMLFNLDAIDGNTQTHPNFPCWAIFDAQAREKYPFGTVMPGSDVPEGLGVKADTIEELARKTGIDVEGLTRTVASFNEHAARGEDPEFHRGTHPWSAWMCGDTQYKPNPNLGTVEKGPFYAIELHRLGNSAIPATGLVIDHHSRAVGWDNQPIPGLYAAGNSVARLESGAMMQSGVSNGRGMTYGYLAGLHASGRGSDLLQKEIDRMGLAA